MRLIKLSLGGIFVAVATVASLGGMNLYTYHRFTDESALGTLHFAELSPRRYRVEWRPEAADKQAFELRGDEWQFDVRMIKWTDWLTFLGEDPLYRLDRISSRYVSADEARNQAPDVHPLAVEQSFDVWSFAQSAGEWLPGVDAAYGSSVFLDMRDGAAYRVSMTRTGLVARPIAEQAAD